MKASILQTLAKLQALSLREQLMVILGLPLLLVVLSEQFWFGPSRTLAADALKQSTRQQAEFKELSAALAARPAVAPLPAADQLERQRDEMLARIEAVRRYDGSSGDAVAWGSVVRATAEGTPGLKLTQLRTLKAEVVYSPAMALAATAATAAKARPGAAPAAAAASGAAAAASGAAAAASGAAASAAAATPVTVYRHRAELTITGDFAALLACLQSLRSVPGDLRWDRLALNVAAYPQASVQLGLHTLSNSPDTPFN